jgi:hypothetical protein
MSSKDTVVVLSQNALERKVLLPWCLLLLDFSCAGQEPEKAEDYKPSLDITREKMIPVSSLATARCCCQAVDFAGSGPQPAVPATAWRREVMDAPARRGVARRRGLQCEV